MKVYPSDDQNRHLMEKRFLRVHRLIEKSSEEFNDTSIGGEVKHCFPKKSDLESQTFHKS